MREFSEIGGEVIPMTLSLRVQFSMTIPGILGISFVKDLGLLRVTPGEDKPADPFLDRSSLVDVVV